MAFPTSPTNGQQANINGITYTYSSAATAWTVSTSVSNTFVSINVSNNVNSGNVLATGVISATGNVSGGNLSGTSIVGTLTTAAQTNITSVGTLGSLTVTANTTSGNILTGGLISAAGNISANNATFTSNQTLSYGTANGVIYLNSNKVATSGTVLQFDGTNLGLGTTSPSTGKFGDASYAFLIQSASTSTGTNIFASNSDNSKFVGVWSGHSSANSAVGVKSGTALTFGAWSAITGVGGFTEWARFDSSGNLVVGGTSPTTSSGYTSLSINNATNSGYLVLQSNGTNKSDWFVSGGTAAILRGVAVPLVLTATGANYLSFETNSTERARIDSSGNFSITQTPGKYTVDVTGGATSIANGGTVDFASASGMLVVNNWTNGAVSIYLCGSGNVQLVSSVTAQVGTFNYNSGIGGYTWTNNYGATATFGFFFIRTRITA